MDNLQILEETIPREYILGHRGLSEYTESSAPAPAANYGHFFTEFERGELEPYRGTFILYWKGIRAGQSDNQKKLYDEFGKHHGYSNITVFRVPRKGESLENALQDAI